MRTGFLFNHDQIHQIAHGLPVALALAKARPEHEVIIATTNALIAAEVTRQIGLDRPANIKHVGLCLRSRASKLLASIAGAVLPASKLLVLRDNLAFFRSLDALVVTERTSLVLKTRYGLNKIRMILTDHGAGDRAIGFCKSTALFDHILAAGPKIRDRMVRDARVDASRLTITGYPKFDRVARTNTRLPFQSKHQPIVLYNPHVSPHLSSWYKQGRAVLDHFLDNPRYNLIFAPHIMMFQRKAVVTIDRLSIDFPGKLDPKYTEAPNIHIDLGSVASTDMSYTDAADIYLGDVSSQVYEFLLRPRPCVFLNTHGVVHEGDPNYAHWQAGPVISKVEHLGAALDDAVEGHATHYRAIQKSLFDYSFDLTDEPSSVRAARAIIGLLGLTAEQPQKKGAPVLCLRPFIPQPELSAESSGILAIS
jgi:hypothetical protein